MDAAFLNEIRTSREVRFLTSHLKRVSELPAVHPERMVVLAEAMQTWVAIAAAAGRSTGPNYDCDAGALEIALAGSKATQDAMLNGSNDAVMRSADAFKVFVASQPTAEV